jgi:hypothetical protein
MYSKILRLCRGSSSREYLWRGFRAYAGSFSTTYATVIDLAVPLLFARFDVYDTMHASSILTRYNALLLSEHPCGRPDSISEPIISSFPSASSPFQHRLLT